jgi:hypothetical protein
MRSKSKLKYPKSQADLVVNTVEKLKENDLSLCSIMKNVDQLLSDPTCKTKTGTITNGKISELRHQVFGSKQDGKRPLSESRLNNNSLKSIVKQTTNKSDSESKKTVLEQRADQKLSTNVNDERHGFGELFPETTDPFISSTPKSTRSASMTSQDSKSKPIETNKTKKPSTSKRIGPISVKTLEFGNSGLMSNRFNEQLNKNRRPVSHTPREKQIELKSKKTEQLSTGRKQLIGKPVKRTEVEVKRPTEDARVEDQSGKINEINAMKTDEEPSLEAKGPPSSRKPEQDERETELDSFFNGSISISSPIKSKDRKQAPNVDLDQNDQEELNKWSSDENPLNIEKHEEEGKPITQQKPEKSILDLVVEGEKSNQLIETHTPVKKAWEFHEPVSDDEADKLRSYKLENKVEESLLKSQQPNELTTSSQEPGAMIDRKFEPVKQDENFFQKRPTSKQNKPIIKHEVRNNENPKQSRKQVIFFEDPKYGFMRKEVPGWVDEYRSYTAEISLDSQQWSAEPIKNFYSNDCIRSSMKSKPWHDNETWQGYHNDQGLFVKKTKQTFFSSGVKPVKVVGVLSFEPSKVVSKIRVNTK